MTDAATIHRDARTLKPTERLRLIEMLLADLDQPDEQIDEAWAAEAQRRWDAFQRGSLKTIPHEEVMARYRRR